MRIGVYTIALNEAAFAKRWANSAANADYILVTDTGSRDDTPRILEDNGVHVTQISIRPWRFDDARNVSLALMPADLDVVIALDMDEVLKPDWRDIIEREWNGCTRLRYRYVWSWTAPGVPDLIYYGDKISGRHTHRWKHPVHEVLTPTVPEVVKFCDDILIEHHPDNSKQRSQYLPLLELAVNEAPGDDRNAYYLGREYFLKGRYQDAITELHRHLALPSATWAAERAASMRHIAKSYECLKDEAKAYEWFTKATLEDPSSREALIDAARFALSRNEFHLTLHYCERALAIPAQSGNYLNERYAREEGPYDLAATAHFYLNNRFKAIELAQKAISLNPHDQRLRDNLKMMNPCM